jgi:cyclophilin family peptidyl-prolyl cis-trans isomerase
MTTATITTNKGAIKLELFTEQAPETRHGNRRRGLQIR